MRSSRAIVLAIGMSALAGVAAAMPNDPPQAAPSSQTAAPAAATAQDQKAKDQAIMIQRARDAGFKPKKHNDEIWYCKKAIPIGSRLPVEQCANESELMLLLDRAQETRDTMKILNSTPGMRGG